MNFFWKFLPGLPAPSVGVSVRAVLHALLSVGTEVSEVIEGTGAYDALMKTVVLTGIM